LNNRNGKKNKMEEDKKGVPKNKKKNIFNKNRLPHLPAPFTTNDGQISGGPCDGFHEKRHSIFIKQGNSNML